MKKILILSVLICVLAMVMSTIAYGQVVIPKVGGSDITDGSGQDTLGVPETPVGAFVVNAAIDPQHQKILLTFFKEVEGPSASPTKVDVNDDGIDDFDVNIDDDSDTVVVRADSDGNGVIGDGSDDSLTPPPGTNSFDDLILPNGDILNAAAGTDVYDGALFSQVSFYPVGPTFTVTDPDTGEFVIFELPPREENCLDGIDGDGDLFTDCEDSDCIYEPSCDTGKNKIAYNFRRLRAEAEDVGGSLAGEVMFEYAITPRHHEAAFAEGPVHWSVMPMMDDFEISASVSINPMADGVQILAMSKSPDLPNFPYVPQGPGLFPGYGGGEILDPDDFAIMKAIGDAYDKGCQDPVIEINNVGTLEITQTVGANTYVDTIPADRVRISGVLTTRDDGGEFDLQGNPYFIVTDVKIVSFAPSTNLVSDANSDLHISINSEIEFTGTLSDLVKEQYDFVNTQAAGTIAITGGPIPGKSGSDFEISGPSFIKRIN